MPVMPCRLRKACFLGRFSMLYLWSRRPKTSVLPASVHVHSGMVGTDTSLFLLYSELSKTTSIISREVSAVPCDSA